MAAILKFEMFATTKWSSDVVNVLIGFYDPENVGIDTRIMHLPVTENEI